MSTDEPTTQMASIGTTVGKLNESRPWFLHSLLLLGLLLYAAFGGLILIVLENETQLTAWQTLIRKCLKDYRNESVPVDVGEQMVSDCLLEELTEEESYQQEWTLLGAALFGFGLVTTLGIGRPAPMTIGGRLFCVAFGLFGIPLAMLVLANIGKTLKDDYSDYRTRFEAFVRRRARARSRRGMVAVVERTVEAGNCLTPEDGCVATVPADEAEDNEAIEATALVVFIGFVCYIVLGAALLTAIHGRVDFISGIYFTFLSLTALEFKAIIPLANKPFAMPFVLAYICMGLALTTIAIDVGSDYLKHFHYYGVHITDVKNAWIWFGGKKIRLKHVMASFCASCGISKSVFDKLDLDDIIRKAIKKQEDGTNAHENDGEPEDVKATLLGDEIPPIDDEADAIVSTPASRAVTPLELSRRLHRLTPPSTGSGRRRNRSSAAAFVFSSSSSPVDGQTAKIDDVTTDAPSSLLSACLEEDVATTTSGGQPAVIASPTTSNGRRSDGNRLDSSSPADGQIAKIDDVTADAPSTPLSACLEEDVATTTSGGLPAVIASPATSNGRPDGNHLDTESDSLSTEFRINIEATADHNQSEDGRECLTAEHLDINNQTDVDEVLGEGERAYSTAKQSDQRMASSEIVRLEDERNSGENSCLISVASDPLIEPESYSTNIRVTVDEDQVDIPQQESANEFVSNNVTTEDTRKEDLSVVAESVKDTIPSADPALVKQPPPNYLDSYPKVDERLEKTENKVDQHNSAEYTSDKDDVTLVPIEVTAASMESLSGDNVASTSRLHRKVVPSPSTERRKTMIPKKSHLPTMSKQMSKSNGNISTLAEKHGDPKTFAAKKAMYGQDSKKLLDIYRDEWNRFNRRSSYASQTGLNKT